MICILNPTLAFCVSCTGLTLVHPNATAFVIVLYYFMTCRVFDVTNLIDTGNRIVG